MNNSGMVILDNMALQGAARALSRYQPDLRRTANHRREPHKWNYPYCDDLRLTADVLALAQLVQSIVLYDKVGIGPYGTPSWAKTRDWHSDELEAPDELDGVTGLLTILDRGYDHARLIAEATLRAQEHARSEYFRDYVQTLEDRDALGAYLRISDHYFSTGFSDDLLCGDSADRAIYELLSGVRRRYRAAGHAGFSTWLLISLVPGFGRRRTFAKLNKAVIHERKLRYKSDVDVTLHPFDFTQVGQAEFPAKVNASLDLVRNVAATYYYDQLAAHANAAYAPHPLRTRFVEYQAADELSPAELVRRIEERRAENVRAARRKITGTFPSGENLVEVRLPLFLATVLAESAEPEDVIAQALHLRDSPPARRLRAWFEETGKLSRSGDLSVDQLTSRVQELEDALDTWWSPEQQHNGKITISLTAGPLAVQAQGVSLPLPRLGKRRPRTFRLLYDLAQISRDNLSLAPQLGRVLGTDAADAWRRCAGVFAELTSDPPTRSPR